MSPRKHLTAVAPSGTNPRHTHTPVAAPVRGTFGKRTNPIREFALIGRHIARSAGLIDSRGVLQDHSLTPEALRSLAFAFVKDRRGTDDCLATLAPGIVADHGRADAVAAQLNHGHDMGIGDLTFWVEADDLPDAGPRVVVPLYPTSNQTAQAA